MLKKIILVAAAAIGGIYLTSEEGKQARETLMQKKAVFESVVKDLLKQASKVLEGSQSINSDEIRANVNLLVKEAKTALNDLDFDKTVSTIREAIAVASKKIRTAADEVNVANRLDRKPAAPKKVVTKADTKSKDKE